MEDSVQTSGGRGCGYNNVKCSCSARSRDSSVGRAEDCRGESKQSLGQWFESASRERYFFSVLFFVYNVERSLSMIFFIHKTHFIYYVVLNIFYVPLWPLVNLYKSFKCSPTFSLIHFLCLQCTTRFIYDFSFMHKTHFNCYVVPIFLIFVVVNQSVNLYESFKRSPTLPFSSICHQALEHFVKLFYIHPLPFCCCAFRFGLLLLSCFDNNLKLHLAIVNAYMTVFSFIGNH